MPFRLFFQRILSLCFKELLVILKDPANRMVLVMPIILQTIVFGYAATYDLNNIPYVVVDQSRSVLSRDFLARLDGSGKFSRMATLESRSQMEEWISDGKALMAVQFATDFADRLHSGRNADIQIILDGRNSTTASIAVTYVNQIVTAWNSARGLSSPVQSVVQAWFNPQLETRWNIMPGMIASLSLMQIMVLAALSVAREREQGTFDQMLVTPLSPWEILVGKSIPPLLIGIFQSFLILLISIYWFNIPFRGSYALLLLSLFIFTQTCAGIGLCVSAVSRTMQQAMVYCFVLIVPMIMLSGLATPISSMPDFMQTATYANPLRFVLVCIRSIYLENAPLSSIYQNFYPMLAFAVVAYPLAGWLFRNRIS